MFSVTRSGKVGRGADLKLTENNRFVYFEPKFKSSQYPLLTPPICKHSFPLLVYIVLNIKPSVKCGTKCFPLNHEFQRGKGTDKCDDAIYQYRPTAAAKANACTTTYLK